MGVALSAWVTRSAAFVGVDAITAPERGSKRARRASRMGAGRAGSMKTPGGTGVGVSGMGVCGSGVGVGAGEVWVGKKVTATGGDGWVAVGVEAQAARSAAATNTPRQCSFRFACIGSFYAGMSLLGPGQDLLSRKRSVKIVAASVGAIRVRG